MDQSREEALLKQVPDNFLITPNNYRPQGRDPTERYSGDSPEKYAVWRYEVDQKFDDDQILFQTDLKKIAYARAQLTGDAFSHMTNWKMTTPLNDQTIESFFTEIEFFSGTSDLTELAQSTLLTIRQKSGENISKFYQRISVLWTRANYSEPERIRSFIKSSNPNLTRNILHLEFSRTQQILQALRTVENRKLGIDNHQPRGPLFRNLANAGNSNSKPIPSLSSPTNNKIPPKIQSFFPPTTVKPENWTGPWYQPEDNPAKLQPGESAVLAAQGRCFRCRGSGHKASDMTICPKKNKTSRFVNLLDVDCSKDESNDEDHLKAFT
ncbi:hypothetical protein EV44_g5230 [Erysiphe necator]|uniref:Retrotransposon gag domain-containing protein n=1 Tax=Uncinula necator TaxID=52586 RepID=A0A0B1NX78_UNCNE|nr:hypothetical protein EV44_g5230 [Erysiphe necator]